MLLKSFFFAMLQEIYFKITFDLLFSYEIGTIYSIFFSDKVEGTNRLGEFLRCYTPDVSIGTRVKFIYLHC